jgi:hypothetical protein
MKRCAAFVVDRQSASAWRQCRRRSQRCSTFCRQHEELVAGVMLGFFARQAVTDLRKLRKMALEEMPVSSRVPS